MNIEPKENKYIFSVKTMLLPITKSIHEIKINLLKCIAFL